MYGYVHVAWLGQVHPIAWTIPQCVLVLKLIGQFLIVILDMLQVSQNVSLVVNCTVMLPATNLSMYAW